MGWAAILRSPVVRKAVAGLALSAAGVTAIITHEGNVPVVYKDVVGINTVCVGHVTKLAVGTPVDDETCKELLVADTAIAQSAIKRGVKVPLSQGQYDALTSFVFNVGSGAFTSSTLLRKFNAGDCHGAASEFQKWDMAGGRHIPGLLKRRNAERVMFEKDCP